MFNLQNGAAVATEKTEILHTNLVRATTENFHFLRFMTFSCVTVLFAVGVQKYWLQEHLY